MDSINLPRIEEQVIVDLEEATTISRRKAQRQLERLRLMVQANGGCHSPRTNSVLTSLTFAESSDRINEFYKINYEALHHLATENNLAKKHLEDYEAAIRQTSGIVPT